MKKRASFTARLRKAARRRLSRFTNAGPARAMAEVAEAREARFVDGPVAGVRLPREARFVPPPEGLTEHALAVPAALLDGGLPEPEAMGRVAAVAARLNPPAVFPAAGRARFGQRT